MAAACVFFSVVAVVALMAFIVVDMLGGTIETVGFGLSSTASYARVDCAQPPPPSAAADSSAFIQDLLPLLAALPAAAAPLGFASLQSGGAFVRGLCIGAYPESDCPACLAAAARNLAGCFLGGSRRAGVWSSDSCFLAYADANGSTSREDAFRDVVIAGEDPGEGPNCFNRRRLVALVHSMARRVPAYGPWLGVHVDTDAAALARDATGTRKKTVRVFPDVARGPTTVSVLAQCAWERAVPG
jgi:hypothetical protein